MLPGPCKRVPSTQRRTISIKLALVYFACNIGYYFCMRKVGNLSKFLGTQMFLHRLFLSKKSDKLLLYVILGCRRCLLSSAQSTALSPLVARFLHGAVSASPYSKNSWSSPYSLKCPNRISPKNGLVMNNLRWMCSGMSG